MRLGNYLTSGQTREVEAEVALSGSQLLSLLHMKTLQERAAAETEAVVGVAGIKTNTDYNILFFSLVIKNS